METWAWLIAYLLGFILLQFYLYRYFIKGNSTTGSSPENATPRFEGGGTAVEPPERNAADADPADRESADADPQGDFVACAACGVHNEQSPVYTYCKHCGARL